MKIDIRSNYIRLLYERDALYERYARQHGIQGKALQMLLWIVNSSQEGGDYATQKFLAEKTYSTKQVVNATINRWQKQGYIELIEIKKDRRHKIIRLTETGKKYAHRITDPLQKIERQSLDILNDEQLETLVSLTAQYNESLKERMNKI